MEVRSFKLPPLPGKRAPPIQIINRPNRLQPDYPIPSISREKKVTEGEERSSSRTYSMKRPSSVRQRSKESVYSRESNDSRNSSRNKIINRVNHNLKARVSMPFVSSKSWAVFEMKEKKLLYGKRISRKKEIASLTKMINLITILEIIQNLNLDPKQILVRVSREASVISGTTASIKENYVLNLYSLYFGMMLPSGNDAAFQIAQVGGTLLKIRNSETSIDTELVYNLEIFTEKCEKEKSSVSTYLAEMNKICKKLEMNGSHFANPHGLSNTDNYSCAQDLCKLCTYAMNNQIFREVVLTQSYTTNIEEGNMNAILKDERNIEKEEDDDETETKEGKEEFEQSLSFLNIKEKTLTWENTNKMLKEGWSGLKTGITPNAGPCLAASVKKVVEGREMELLVILIGSVSMEARWKEVREVVEWVLSEKIYI